MTLTVSSLIHSRIIATKYDDGTTIPQLWNVLCLSIVRPPGLDLTVSLRRVCGTSHGQHCYQV